MTQILQKFVYIGVHFHLQVLLFADIAAHIFSHLNTKQQLRKCSSVLFPVAL